MLENPLVISDKFYKEFKYYMRMDTEFIILLNNIVAGAGFIPKIIKDYAEDEALHLFGRAVDIEVPSDGRALFNLFDSIMLYKGRRSVELILHTRDVLHIGLFLSDDLKARSTMEIM